jgi:hypothetical protein
VTYEPITSAFYYVRSGNGEIPVGYLYSAAVPTTETAKIKNAEKMMGYGTSQNVTLNASYGSEYKEFTTYMRQRGMLRILDEWLLTSVTERK